MADNLRARAGKMGKKSNETIGSDERPLDCRNFVVARLWNRGTRLTKQLARTADDLRDGVSWQAGKLASKRYNDMSYFGLFFRYGILDTLL